jgi:hypothetical protein
MSMEIDILNGSISYNNYDPLVPEKTIPYYEYKILCEKENMASEITKFFLDYCSSGKYTLSYYISKIPKWTFRYGGGTRPYSMYIQVYKPYSDEKWKLMFDITGIDRGSTMLYSDKKVIEINNTINSQCFYTCESDKKEFSKIMCRVHRKYAQEGSYA